MEAGLRRRFGGIRRVARTAIQVDAAASEVLGVGVVSTAAMLLYVAIFIPVGLVALFACMAVVIAIAFVLPSPVTGYVVLGGFGLSLVILAVIFVKLYRRLPRQVRDLASDPASLIPGDDEEDFEATAIPPDAPSPHLSLAELDARLAPPPTDQRPA